MTTPIRILSVFSSCSVSRYLLNMVPGPGLHFIQVLERRGCIGIQILIRIFGILLFVLFCHMLLMFAGLSAPSRGTIPHNVAAPPYNPNIHRFIWTALAYDP
jgi:hypothetical protein